MYSVPKSNAFQTVLAQMNMFNSNKHCFNNETNLFVFKDSISEFLHVLSRIKQIDKVAAYKAKSSVV